MRDKRVPSNAECIGTFISIMAILGAVLWSVKPLLG